VLRSRERLAMAPTPGWERPMVSAWATDEPDAEAASEVVDAITPPADERVGAPG
jgi:hypothetical protein